MTLSRIFVLALVIAFACGCASYSARPLENRQGASSILEQREADGLHVAVKDLSASRDSIQYFGRDLLNVGYAPILLLLELDRTSDEVFEVRAEAITLCLRDGTRLTPCGSDEVAEGARFSHVRTFFGFLFILPGFFVASSVNEANEQLAADYQQKAMRSLRINPNVRSSQAVAFFRIEDGGKPFTMEDAFLEMKVYKQGRNGALGRCLEFPVHFGK